MSADEFRKLALSLPETIEREHMDHPDFRVGKKIFATLGYPNDQLAMIKLNTKQRSELIASHPAIFEPVAGGWGKTGATTVHLSRATEEIVLRALWLAWRNVAPKKLAGDFLKNEEQSRKHQDRDERTRKTQ